MKPSNTRLATLLIVLLLAGLAASCVMPVPSNETPVPRVSRTPAPTATATAEPISGDIGDIETYCSALSQRGKKLQATTPEPSARGAEQAGIPVENLPTMQRPPFQNLMYVDKQLLLTGQERAINDVIETFKIQLGDAQYEPITLGGGRTIRLAQVEDERSVEELSCLFERFAAANADLDVAADPNYFISPAGWHGGGSPWTQNGFWASNQPGGGLGHADATQFLNQWALGPEDISLVENGERAVEPKGQGVTVAVLDTAPWKQPCISGWPCSKDVAWQALTQGALGDAEAGSPDMTVWELKPANAATCPGQDAWNEDLDREAQNINNHGLFVASLAHAVAPQSKIHLLRVLEDDGCGDLFKVLQGLQQFENYMMASSQTGVIGGDQPLTNTVVNLSLGIHRPDDAQALGLPAEVTALQAKLDHMIGLGAVVVAAAGNDSFSADLAASSPADAYAPLPAEIPAGDAQVIGVAASTHAKQRGCFSNIGDVAAPGGNGLTLSQIVPPDPTLTAAAAAGDYVNCIVPGQVDPNSKDFWCEQTGNETYCLVGVGIDPNGRTPRYLYWSGTSFATPLVSGIAALKLQEGVPPDQVDDEIYATVDPSTPGTPFLGAGIANAAN